MNSPGTTRRFQLCTIEPTVDITDGTDGANGTLVLSRVEEIFQLHWTTLDGSPTQLVTAALQSPSSFKSESWTSGSRFQIDCSLIQQLKLGQNPNSLAIYRFDQQGYRKFSFSDAEFISMTELVEQLIINGIAVPSAQEEYSLEFYRRCHRGVYPYTPPHIQLAVDTNCDLPTFWNRLHEFFQTLIIHLDSSDTLPKDPQFPLNVAARAAHARVIKKINEYASNINHYNTITETEWDSLFDSEGKLVDPNEFKQRLYHSGIEESIMEKALPFIVGVYPIESSAAERSKIGQELNAEFELLQAQALSFKPEQIDNNQKLSSAFRVIKHDVSRTDRHLPAFKNKKAPGLKMVTRLLKTYCVFNPPIGYLQGMNDLFVPILLAFLPNWDATGNPVGKDGQIVDHTPYLPTIFWCFDAMLRNTDHLELLRSVTEKCQKQAEAIFQILNKISPLAAIWMRRNNLKELLWCYSDFVLLFKRTFSDIWRVWLQLNCSPRPEKWLTYFVAAIIVQGFDAIASLDDVSITAMMDAFPKILANLQLENIGNTALWLAENVPAPFTQTGAPEQQNVQMDGFRFFQTAWTGPSLTAQQFPK